MESLIGYEVRTFDGEEVKVPDKIIHKDIYAEWWVRMKRMDKHPDRFQMTSNNKRVDLTAPKVSLRKALKGLPSEEYNKYMALAETFTSERCSLTVLKRKLKSIDGNGYKAESIIEVKETEILELFGRYFTESEVHKIINEDWGYDVSFYAIRKFVIRNREKIQELQRKEDENYCDINIGVKRSRLGKLNYLLQDRLQIYEKGHNREDSKEIRAILDQARKEVEGDNLNIKVDGSIDIEITLKNERMESMLNQLTINQIILSRVAARMNVNSTYIISRLINSYYSKFNGFKRNDDIQGSKPIYPSSIDYDFDTISARNAHMVNSELKQQQLPEISDTEKVNTVRERLLRAITEKKRMLEEQGKISG